MAYEIPQNLQYEEKIMFNLTKNQLLSLGLFLGLGAIIFIRATAPFEIKLILTVVFISFGIGFAFFGFSNHVKNLLIFRKSVRRAGYFDKKLRNMIQVDEIENDCVYMKNGSIRAIIEITPLNFSMLSLQEQEAIVNSYKDFINSLDFPIQIVMKTVNLSLENYLKKIEQRVLEKKNDKLTEHFNSFREFTNEFISNNQVKNRLFYLVIPYSPDYKANPLKDIVIRIKNNFTKNKEKTSVETNKENSLNELKIRTNLCREKLKKCNLLTKRLSDQELISLNSSFFDNFSEIKENYLSRFTGIEKQEKNGDQKKWVDSRGGEVNLENAAMEEIK